MATVTAFTAFSNCQILSGFLKSCLFVCCFSQGSGYFDFAWCTRHNSHLPCRGHFFRLHGQFFDVFIKTSDNKTRLTDNPLNGFSSVKLRITVK